MQNTSILFTSTDYQYVFKKYCLNERKLEGGAVYTESLFDKSSIGQGRPPFRPFGICYYKDKILVASNSLIAEYDAQNYQFIRLLPDTPNFVNTHQIRCYEDELYICNTAVNTLCMYNMKTANTRIFDTTTLKEEDQQPRPQHCRQYDTKHVNSVYKFEGKIYMLLHNCGRSNSQIVVIQEKTLEFIKLIEVPSTTCHDLYVTKDYIYTLSTDTGSIIKIGNNKNYIQKLCEASKFWLRGMRSFNDHLLVAISGHRKANTPINAFLKIAEQNLTILEQYTLSEVFEITDICN